MKVISVLLFTALICHTLARPQIPDQVQEFLRQAFFNPIEEAAEDGAEKVDHAISQIANATREHLGPLVENSPLADIISKIKGMEEEKEEAEEEATTTETTTNAIEEEVVEITTTMPQPTSTKPSAKTKVFYLDEDSKAKMRSLCPDIANLTDTEVQWRRYYEPKGACFKYGFQGPCGAGMKLFIKEHGSIFGGCDCRRDARFHVYHEETNACYPIFSKGGCKEGEYMDITREGKPTCSVNPCASEKGEFVKLKGVCTELKKPNKEICANNSVVDFIVNRRTPDCVLTQKIATAVGILPCSPGSLLAIHGKCHIASWDFGQEDD